MKTLFAGFEGLKNSSKMVLNKLDNCDKICFKNDKLKSYKQIVNAITKNEYDYCIILEQKPVMKIKSQLNYKQKTMKIQRKKILISTGCANASKHLELITIYHIKQVLPIAIIFIIIHWHLLSIIT